jgi:hypothetical protein
MVWNILISIFFYYLIQKTKKVTEGFFIFCNVLYFTKDTETIFQLCW